LPHRCSCRFDAAYSETLYHDYTPQSHPANPSVCYQGIPLSGIGVILGALLVLAIGGASAAVWWAKTVVAAKDTEIAVERRNVQNLKISSEGLWKALHAKTQEVQSLQAECERLKARTFPPKTVPSGVRVLADRKVGRELSYEEAQRAADRSEAA
jgi:hypothetical protein